MKKTLIVLVALAGGAMAAEEALTLTSPANGFLETGNAAIAWSEDYTKLESWELSFDLVLKDSTYPSEAHAFFGTHSIDSGCEGYVLRITENGAIQLGYRDHPHINPTYITTSDDIVTTDKNFGITLKFVADVTADGTLKGGTFTLTCGEESHDYTLPQGTDGDYLTYTALEKNANSKFWTNGTEEKFYNISVTKLDSIVVPEPTTATLSLLALAGLAARRRRK